MHLKVGFKGNKEPDRVPDKIEHYEGEKITIHDNRGVCAHSGFCTDNFPVHALQSLNWSVTQMGVYFFFKPGDGDRTGAGTWQNREKIFKRFFNGSREHYIRNELYPAYVR